MKIAIIEPVGSHGGMNYYDYGLSYGLSKNNVSVYYFTCNKTEYRDYPELTLLQSFGPIWEKKGIVKLFWFFRGYIVAMLHARKHNVSIFHFHFFNLGVLNCLILLFAKFFSCKVVVTMHDVNPFIGKSNKFLENFAFKLADGFIVHNELCKREIIEKNVAESKIAVIPHGNYYPFIDKLNYSPNENNKFEILFFGQIKEVKGLDILLKAMHIVSNSNKNIHLNIAGRVWKDDETKYTKMISELNISTSVSTNFRYIKDDEIKELFNRSTLVVLPYKRIYQSGVLLLTMSYGRPVLTSDLEAFKEIVTHGDNGFVFKSQDTEDLAEKILYIYENRQNLFQIEQNASKLLAQKYDWVKIGLLTKNYYKSLI